MGYWLLHARYPVDETFVNGNMTNGTTSAAHIITSFSVFGFCTKKIWSEHIYILVTTLSVNNSESYPLQYSSCLSFFLSFFLSLFLSLSLFFSFLFRFLPLSIFFSSSLHGELKLIITVEPVDYVNQYSGHYFC